MDLTRQGFTKEFLTYYGKYLDIIKLSTRAASDKELEETFSNFISPQESNRFANTIFNGKLPEEFMEQRFHCKHNCKECLFCKKIYEQYECKPAI